MTKPEDISHRRVLHIAFPIVVSNATVPILGAVDTGVVGQMGLAAPIGAVAIGTVILSGIYWIFVFLRMGTSGLTGQALGAGDTDEVKALLARVLLISGGIGALIIVFQVPLLWGAFQMSPASQEIEELAKDYLQIRIFSAPAAIALLGVTGWLIAQERTRAVLLLQLWMNGINIGLDFWFVLGLDWGVPGVAFATFIAEWSALALGLYICRDGFSKAIWFSKRHVFDGERLKTMAAVNRDIFIRSIILQAIFISFLFYSSSIGDVELAANQILMQFLYISGFALNGFAFAAEALVAQAMGARAPDKVRRSALLTSFWGLNCVLFLSVVFYFFGGLIIDVMTTAPEVRMTARTYLIYMIAAPIIGVAAWMLDGIFVGATRSVDMRNMMIISAFVYFAALLILVPIFGNHGLWIALLISFLTRGITLALRYRALEAAVIYR
ncbi:MAG: MATE family efflux transporter [Sneathiella sp.]|nr:MATE family efflux transporter [Sneathiella sp.]